MTALTRAQELSQFWQPICHSYQQGLTVLPPFLGLSAEGFQALCDDFASVGLTVIVDTAQHHSPVRRLRNDLLVMREPELQELLDLLHQHSNPDAHYQQLAATVIAYGCLGSQHLWKDLGLPERPRLSQLFAWYFPALFQRNDRNMRWKRFLYKQLCESGGDYVCRAPSCEQCSTYAECFGPES
ncbi:nitrogen fixation protein NifQ [Shewanella sp. C32]|uniref:Nitrogen fixation protein NifQ n=1 Tax=Shewanella electrica TaxID=515560 RepID=A0ABT2FHZ6_9GAMM|nr:nitrogen fixation protein NifQ [Shewanella electrica]MCH1924023.1 nitrogen fixation protein NifQ [Shewanella electrica]MCS4555926.1 nitrogen fixation protein NifQ [Shewanella electrica]